MPPYGRLEPFEGHRSAWAIYEEEEHLFFRANDTSEANQWDIFCASCATRVFSLLLDLLKPATPHCKTLGELLAILRSHFNPAPPTLMERFCFNNRSPREGEIHGEFSAALRGLASACIFGDQLDSLLRDRFICGINNTAMRTRLLELPDLSLDDTVKAALAMEDAAKHSAEIARVAGSTSAEAAVNKLVTNGKYQEVSLHAVKDVPSLLTELKSLLQPGVGTFFKPPLLPFALKDGVAQELQRLQREGILVPVKTSDRASYHPLSGGQKFPKLNLRDAYQQLVLQDASRKYVTISTTLRLFQYTRLPFGVASAPAIFQREMDNLFMGMRHVAVYLDDILVSGSDDRDRVQNLHNVLAQLQDAGLKLKLEKWIFLAPIVEYLGYVISQYLWVRKFEAVTAHKPLLGPDKAVPVQAVPVHASPRVVRWAFRLAAYSYQVVYCPGKDLGPADALSRLPLPEVPDAVPEPAEVFMLEHVYPKALSRSAVSQATSQDPVLSKVTKAVCRGALAQQAYSHKAAELSSQQGCLLWETLVPPTCGFWGNLQGPLLPGGGGRLSKWVKVLPVTTPSADTTIAALRQVFAAQQLPDVIVSDNGSAFASTEYLA
ncbi:uncharacterized protein [Dermacentor albipictus]|uniref:uncharacterized protein n=1 Tax=Dermacentor albipictus TaxID=60249 RepID=UPI0038FC0459